MSLCEKCGTKGRVLATRRKETGDVRRRFLCEQCGHRWNVLNGEKLPSIIPASRFSDSAILDILTTQATQAVLSVRYGCSPSTIGQIRRGELHPGVHPEIPRFKDKEKPGRKTCPKCIHYTSVKEAPCGLGHVDPIEEGLSFASYCCNFKNASDK